jgi:hypothetical protein
MNGLEKKLRERQRRLSEPIDIFEYDENARFLIGWPGYRTANNKSGLGYVETQAELAHMQGLMLRWLITGKFISHNPIYLFLMFTFGLLAGGIPLVLVLAEIFNSHNLGFMPFATPLFSPYVLVGILIIINVLISLFNPRAKSITGD